MCQARHRWSGSEGVACPGAGGALLGVLCPSGTSAAPGASERAGGGAGRGAGLVGRGAHGRLRAMQDELGRKLEAVGVGFQVKCATRRRERGGCSARNARIVPETLRRSCRKSHQPCADPHGSWWIGRMCGWSCCGGSRREKTERGTQGARGVGSAQGFGDNPRSFNGQRRNSPGILQWQYQLRQHRLERHLVEVYLLPTW